MGAYAHVHTKIFSSGSGHFTDFLESLNAAHSAV